MPICSIRKRTGVEEQNPQLVQQMLLQGEGSSPPKTCSRMHHRLRPSAPCTAPRACLAMPPTHAPCTLTPAAAVSHALLRPPSGRPCMRARSHPCPCPPVSPLPLPHPHPTPPHPASPGLTGLAWPGPLAHPPAHPPAGNLLRTPDGRLAYLDFGMMGQVDEKTRTVRGGAGRDGTGQGRGGEGGPGRALPPSSSEVCRQAGAPLPACAALCCPVRPLPKYVQPGAPPPPTPVCPSSGPDDHVLHPR